MPATIVTQTTTKSTDQRQAPTPPTKLNLREIAERAISDKTVVRCFFPTSEARLAPVKREIAPPPTETKAAEVVVDQVTKADGDGTSGGDSSSSTPIEAVINTADVDRYQTIVDPAGAELEEYAENPVLLWQHGLDSNIGNWPVGKVSKLNKGAEIVAALLFDSSPLGQELDRLYREKMLRGFSIGFIPKAYVVEMIAEQEILRYTKWTLVELSCVAVPANPKALARDLSNAAVNDDAKLKEFRAYIAKQVADFAVRALVEDQDSTVQTRSTTVAPVSKGALTNSGSGANVTAFPPTSQRAEIVNEPNKGAGTCAFVFDRAFKHKAECQAASPEGIRAMAALVVEEQGETPMRALFVHHHADGDVSYPALAVNMTRLLMENDELTGEQKDAIYDHLAAHYREAGIEPPPGGYATPDEVFGMALEGRTAYVDEAGYGWMFAEAVEREGRTFPGFIRVDDPKAKLILEPPADGPHADHRGWGKRKPLARSGAKFSYQTKAALASAAAHIDEVCETIVKEVNDRLTSLREVATGLRGMLEPKESNDEGGNGSGRSSGVGGSTAGDGAQGQQIDTGFVRQLAAEEIDKALRS